VFISSGIINSILQMTFHHRQSCFSEITKLSPSLRYTCLDPAVKIQLISNRTEHTKNNTFKSHVQKMTGIHVYFPMEQQSPVDQVLSSSRLHDHTQKHYVR